MKWSERLKIPCSVLREMRTLLQFKVLYWFSTTKVPPFLWHNARIRVANLSPVLPRWSVFPIT
jgi:hypothetical protein